MGGLDGRVAVVTGTSRGIGKAIAELFAAEGASVVCAARTVREGDHPLEGALHTTVEGIRAGGGEAIAIQANVAVEDDCFRLIEQAEANYGPVDILVNNAVNSSYFPVAEFLPRRWKLGFEVNIHAPFLLSQLVLPKMIERKSGAICNISSGAATGPGRGPYRATDAMEGMDGGVMYGASKAALERFTQGLAVEVHPHGIAVTALSPSQVVLTPSATLWAARGPGGREDIDDEPVEYMARAALRLVSEPLDRVTGWVAYSQQVLGEFGDIEEARGRGVNSPGSGFSLR